MIKVQFEPLAIGLYKLLKEHKEFSAISYGMLPADFMESLDRMLKDKIPDYYWDKATLLDICGKKERSDLVNKLASYFITQATKEGFCHV